MTLNLSKLPDPYNHAYHLPIPKFHCSRLHFIAPLEKKMGEAGQQGLQMSNILTVPGKTVDLNHRLCNKMYILQ